MSVFKERFGILGANGFGINEAYHVKSDCKDAYVPRWGGRDIQSCWDSSELLSK